MVDNAVRTHFEPYERHFKEIGFNENTIKKYLQCTNIQTVTMPVPAKFYVLQMYRLDCLMK